MVSLDSDAHDTFLVVVIHHFVEQLWTPGDGEQEQVFTHQLACLRQAVVSRIAGMQVLVHVLQVVHQGEAAAHLGEPFHRDLQSLHAPEQGRILEDTGFTPFDDHVEKRGAVEFLVEDDIGAIDLAILGEVLHPTGVHLQAGGSRYRPYQHQAGQAPGENRAGSKSASQGHQVAGRAGADAVHPQGAAPFVISGHLWSQEGEDGGHQSHRYQPGEKNAHHGEHAEDLEGGHLCQQEGGETDGGGHRGGDEGRAEALHGLGDDLPRGPFVVAHHRVAVVAEDVHRVGDAHRYQDHRQHGGDGIHGYPHPGHEAHGPEDGGAHHC